ncbi:MAG: hypothetical protein JWO62_3082 [Acidimicrobiaceae bacterium]|nr:hypothetical protein [Acidimicrobiaceae bacterium]
MHDMSELPTATLIAARFRRGMEYKNAGRLRALVKVRMKSEAWSEFKATLTSAPGYITDSFAPGIGYFPGGAEPTAEFKVTGDLLSVRNTASSLAKQYGQPAVRVNFEAASEAMLFDLDLSLSDWRIEYLLPEDSPAARAEAVFWLTKSSGIDMPVGRVTGDRLVIDGGLGFVARAHRAIAERFGRPVSVASVLVERWGMDGDQRGFLREQRTERATDEEIGRILLA